MLSMVVRGQPDSHEPSSVSLISLQALHASSPRRAVTLFLTSRSPPMKQCLRQRLANAQFAHHGGGRAGRGQGLSHHVEQLRARGLAVRVGTLPVGDAVWVARGRCSFLLSFVLQPAWPFER